MQTLDVKAFQDKLQESHSVLLALGQNPSFDAVASSLSLSLALKEGGKETTVACPTPMIVEFNRLVGVDKVTDNVADKNLTITFENYNAEDIEKVSWNIENGEFTLLVFPKPGVIAPRKEQIKLGYRGVAADLFVVVGVENKGQLGKLESMVDQKSVVIVNNIPTSGFAEPIELIDPAAASVSEVAFQLIESLGLPINKDIATNLLLGLKVGTNNFTVGKVSADTFATASRLMRAGATLDVEEEVRPRVKGPQGVPPDWTQPKIYKGSTLP